MTANGEKAQITSKMHELAGSQCVVKLEPGGDCRGIIERVESLIILNDFPESFERSQFKIHLTSGDIIVAPGSAISDIESTTADRSKQRRRKPGMKAGKAKTGKMLAGKRSAIAARKSKAKLRRATKKRKT